MTSSRELVFRVLTCGGIAGIGQKSYLVWSDVKLYLITDRLKSSGAAKREILPGVEHRQHRYLKNRAENSHQPTRQRERHMRGFKSPGHAQRFLAAYGPIAQHFRPRRHRLSASAYRQEMRHRFDTWQDLTTLRTPA